MAEPTTLYRDNEELTTAAPSEVKRLLAEGWTLEKPAPKPAPKVEPKPEPEEDEKPAPKTTRKPKTKNA